uniref:Uncharacterized protein n=1 Tax=Rhodnius prolixus TaxID=13249 RepID=T1HVV1_RHOPR
MRDTPSSLCMSFKLELSDSEEETCIQGQALGKRSPDPRRWYVLGLYCISAFSQVIVWNTWSPIANSALFAFSTWRDSTIALLNNWGCLMFLLFIGPCCWLLNKGGLKCSFIIASVLCTLGTGIRLLPSNETVFTILVHTGGILNAIGGVTLSPAILLLSSTWFPSNQRTSATGIGTSLSMLGIAGSYVLGPMIVSEPPTTRDTTEQGNLRIKIRSQISLLLFITFLMEISLLFIIILTFPSKPQQPASRASILRLTGDGKKQRFLATVIFRRTLFRNYWTVALSVDPNPGSCPCPDPNPGSCPCPDPDPDPCCPCPDPNPCCPCPDPDPCCPCPDPDPCCPCPDPDPCCPGPNPSPGCPCDTEPGCPCPQPPECPLAPKSRCPLVPLPDPNCPLAEKNTYINRDTCPLGSTKMDGSGDKGCPCSDVSSGCPCPPQNDACCPCPMLSPPKSGCPCKSEQENCMINKIIDEFRKKKKESTCPVKTPPCEKFPEGRCPMEDLGLCDCDYPCPPCMEPPQCGTAKAPPQYCAKKDCCMGLGLPNALSNDRKFAKDGKPFTYYKFVESKPERVETKYHVEFSDEPPNKFPFGIPQERKHPNWNILRSGTAYEKCKVVAEKLKKRAPSTDNGTMFNKNDNLMDPATEHLMKQRKHQAELDKQAEKGQWQ